MFCSVQYEFTHNENMNLYVPKEEDLYVANYLVSKEMTWNISLLVAYKKNRGEYFSVHPGGGELSF